MADLQTHVEQTNTDQGLLHCWCPLKQRYKQVYCNIESVTGPAAGWSSHLPNGSWPSQHFPQRQPSVYQSFTSYMEGVLERRTYWRSQPQDRTVGVCVLCKCSREEGSRSEESIFKIQHYSHCDFYLFWVFFAIGGCDIVASCGRTQWISASNQHHVGWIGWNDGIMEWCNEAVILLLSSGNRHIQSLTHRWDEPAVINVRGVNKPWDSITASIDPLRARLVWLRGATGLGCRLVLWRGGRNSYRFISREWNKKVQLLGLIDILRSDWNQANLAKCLW